MTIITSGNCISMDIFLIVLSLPKLVMEIWVFFPDAKFIGYKLDKKACKLCRGLVVSEVAFFFSSSSNILIKLRLLCRLVVDCDDLSLCSILVFSGVDNSSLAALEILASLRDVFSDLRWPVWNECFLHFLQNTLRWLNFRGSLKHSSLFLVEFFSALLLLFFVFPRFLAFRRFASNLTRQFSPLKRSKQWGQYWRKLFADKSLVVDSLILLT